MRLLLARDLDLDADAADRLRARAGVVLGRFHHLLDRVHIRCKTAKDGDSRLCASLVLTNGTEVHIEMDHEAAELDALEHLIDRAARTLHRGLRNRVQA